MGGAQWKVYDPPPKLDCQLVEKGHLTHVKVWRGKVGRGRYMSEQIFQCSTTHLSYALHVAAEPAPRAPLGHSESIPSESRHQEVLQVSELPVAEQGHLLLFMPSECQCNSLPITITTTRSMQITIGTGDERPDHHFRVHAHHNHYRGPWFDNVEADIEVEGYDSSNMIGHLKRVGQLKVPAGPQAGCCKRFLYCDDILSDTRGGMASVIRRIRNPSTATVQEKRQQQKEVNAK